jgi:hypothetical protein
MFVRKLSIRARAGAGSLQKTPKRNLLRLFTLLTLGTGAVSGFAALVIGAFLTNVQAAAATYLHSNRSADPIQAATLFPPVPAVTKVIDVYDPPPVAAQPRPAPRAPEAAPRPASHEGEGSSPIHSTPSQPGHDD